MKKNIINNISDLIGIVNAGLCFIYFIAEPLKMGICPFSLFQPKYIFVIISFSSFYFSLKRQEMLQVALFQWSCFWLLLLSLFFIEEYTWLKHVGLMTSLLIIVGHIRNMQSRKKCTTAQDKELPERMP